MRNKLLYFLLVSQREELFVRPVQVSVCGRHQRWGSNSLDLCDVSGSLYFFNEYAPSFFLSSLLLLNPRSLLSIAAIHVGQALYFRKWYLFPTIIAGGTGEIIVWAARLASSKQPDAKTPFTVQISTGIMSYVHYLWLCIIAKRS